MQDRSGRELLVKLSSLLRLHGDLILKKQSKLCLTATTLVFLNQCFDDLGSVNQGNSERQNDRLTVLNGQDPSDITFLLDFVRQTPSLKLVQGACLRFDGLVSISCFRALQVLEIKKVPVGFIRGFQSLRPQLKTLICSRSLISLNEVFVHCGGDLLTAPFSWPHLETGDFSYNGIEQLDDSLKLLPALRVLNLSHNSIKSAHSEPHWQYLSGVQHLNVGFNQLNCIPIITAGVGIVTFQVTMLIIRNNNLENLEGLQAFSNLQTLDVSFNCITSFSELTPLAHLHNLTSLHLQGNPVVFYPEYRMITVTCMSPVPRRESIKIDGKPLEPGELIYLGRNVHPVSMLSYIPENSLPNPRLREVRKVTEELVESSESQDDSESTPRQRRPKRKGKKGKSRKVVAREIDFDAEDEGTTTTDDLTVTSTSVEQNLILEYADDVEQLKKLKQLGGEAWLPAIDNMVRNEDHAPDPSDVQPVQEPGVFRSESLQSFSEERIEVNSYASSLSVVTLVDEDITDEHHLVTLLPTGDDEDDGSTEPLFIIVKDDSIIEKNYEGKIICQLETSRITEVVLDCTADGLQSITHVKFDYISRERQARHYVMENQESALQLVEFLKPFVTANAQATMAALEHLQCLKCSAEFTGPVKSDDVICPDCGSNMTVLKPTFSISEADDSSDERPRPASLNKSSIKTIDSEMAVAILVPFVSSSTAAINQKEEDQSDVSDDRTVFENDRVHVDDEADLQQSPPDVIPTLQKTLDSTPAVPDLCTNTSDKQPDRNNEDTSSLSNGNEKKFVIKNSDKFVVNENSGKYFTRKESPARTSALSNSLKDAPKLWQVKEEQSSHSLPSEVRLKTNGGRQNSTESTDKVEQDTTDGFSPTPAPNRKSNGSAKGTEVLSQSLPSHTKSGVLRESLAASIRKLSAQQQTGRSVSPAPRKTSSNINSDGVTQLSVQQAGRSPSPAHRKSSAPVHSDGVTQLSVQQAGRSPSPAHRKSSAPVHSDGATPKPADHVKLSGSLSPTPKFFQGLLNKLSGKLSNSSSSLDSAGNSSAGSSRASTPTIMDNVALSFRLSPDEFSSCDHRLKLFFEVSLFEGGHRERFRCLLKAPVVPYGSATETPSVMVSSNMMVYICRFTLRGSGTPDECLTKLVSHPLDELQYVDLGQGGQSFRLEFSSERACYDFLVRDKDRCEKFLKLFIDSTQQAKAKVGSRPVVVTPPNPQTVEHIRSQVFGVRVEDPVTMCQRLHQQATYFTEPPLIKDRKSLLRSYSSCFVGREFVSWMVRVREVENREEAVAIGQRLLDAGAVEHVSKEQQFEDKDQYYRFIGADKKLERSDSGGDSEVELSGDSLPDLDTSIVLFIMAHQCTNTTRPHYNLSAVSVIVSRTHIALANQNPQWPIPRYTQPPVPLQGPAFVCLAKHKITDVTSLDFYEDDPCFVGISITDEDAPPESAESQWILRTETFTILSSLVKAIKEPWEAQFGVELQKNLYPSITEDKT